MGDRPLGARRRKRERSRCPNCGLDSVTVDGACTNCWALKEDRPSGFAPTRTEPFWRDGSDWGWLWGALGGSTVLGLGVFALLVFGLDALIIGFAVLAVIAVGWAILTGNLS